MSARPHALPTTGLLATLRDGTVCRLRPPRADDRERVLDCFEHLSDTSRQMRFFSDKRMLTDSELDFLTITDGRDHIAVGALVLDPAGAETRILGMARCIRLGPNSDAAEFAIAIADEAQGLGLGRALIEDLMHAAAEQGIRRLELEIRTDNTGMRKLASHFDGESEWLGEGTLRRILHVPAPPAPAGDAAPTPRCGGLEALDLVRQEWLESTDEALSYTRWLTDTIWNMTWQDWLPSETRGGAQAADMSRAPTEPAE